MDKVTARAFDKLQKREHLLKALMNRWELRRITWEMFKAQEAEILKQYMLSDAERRAFEQYTQAQTKRRMK